MGDSGQVQASATTTPAATNPGGNYTAQALTAAGGLTSALAQLQSGKTNQRIARDNAKIAEAQSEEATNAGEFAANRAFARGRQIEAAARATQAGQGTVVGAGTAGLVEKNTEQASQVDAMMIKRNAAREAMGFKTKAAADEIAGNLAAETGKMGALSTLLNTGSQEFLEGDPNFRGYHGSGLKFG